MDLNIRNVPEELAQAIRIKAAEQGVTMRVYVLGVLADNAYDVQTDNRKPFKIGKSK